MLQRSELVKDKLLFQSLAAGMVGTWRWDVQDDTVRTDKSVAHMFGLDEQEAEKGVPLETIIAHIRKEDREKVKRAIDGALKNKDAYEVEYRTISSDGSERWVIARGKVEFDDNGSALTFPGVLIDITDRKIAEAAKSDSESRLNFFADSMPQLVWVSPPDGSPEYFNKQWYNFTGMTLERPEGASWGYMVHPDDRDDVKKVWTRSLESGQPYEFEFRLFHAPSDSYRWVIGRAMPFRDKSGKIVKWYGTCTDIDEQKRSEQIQHFLSHVSKELSSSLNYKKTLKRVTELCVPDIADWCSIDMYDPILGFEQVSIAHVDPDKVEKAKAYRHQNPIKVDDPTGVASVVRTGEMEVHPYIDRALLEKYIKDKEKLEFIASFNMHSIIIAPIIINGKPEGAINFISSDSGRYYTQTDLYMAEETAARISFAITNAKLYSESKEEIKHRKQLEKELREEKSKLESRVKERTAQLTLTNNDLREEIVKRNEVERELEEKSKNLIRSNQELENFAYVASHDLQEPLRKIQAFGNLLHGEYSEQLGPEGIDYIDRMRSAASRMSTLIQDLLAFSRVSTKQNPKTTVDLNQIVKDVLSDLETSIKDADGSVSVSQLPEVIADPTHMRQLFQNLIGNGLKFTRPGNSPHVDVSATEVDDMIEIRFKDNGIGFDEKYLDRIFAVFQRLHDRDSYDGTGIGLAVCRKIVERYGGSITAKSKKDKGATFIVSLPKAIKEA